MGRQSSRMVYQGKDHKDVFFRGSFHNAMYARGEVVWKKLYDKYCYPTGSLRIYDLVENQWQTDKSDYLLSQMRSNLLTAIALITKDKKQYIALTQDLVEWHIVKAIKLPDSDKNFKVVFQNHNEGYFVAVIGGSYNSYENRLYSVDVLWEKKVVELDIPNVNIGMTPIAGISDSFWFFTFKNNQVYFLNKIDRNGILKTKEITDSTFEGFLPYSVFSDICVIDSCVYLFATKIGTDKIFKIMSIHGMDDDTLYTAYPIGRMNNWNYSVVYDDEAKICAMLYKPDYREMRYVQMMGSGTLTHMIYEKENDEINIPIVNSSGLAYNGNPIPDSIDLILSLETDPINRPWQNNVPLEDGYAYYKDLIMYSEYTGNYDTAKSLYIEDGKYTRNCIIATLPRTYDVIEKSRIIKKRLMIFIDNIFCKKSDGNYAVLIDV